MIKFKRLTSALLAAAMVFSLSGAVASAKDVKKDKLKEGQVVKYNFPKHFEEDISIQPRFSSDGVNDTHQLLASQALNIIENDKGSAILEPISEYRKLLLEYCDKPDKDEKDNFFAYHFYNPYTKENYLPSFMSASRITGMVKFKEHMKNAVEYYGEEKAYAMKELGRAIHYLEDINVPHHAANLIAGVSSHSQYESYVSRNTTDFFVDSSKLYDKYSNYSFPKFYEAMFDDCAKHSYSYKDTANSYSESDWRSAATPTTKMAQETIAALVYRFMNEVNR